MDLITRTVLKTKCWCLIIIIVSSLGRIKTTPSQYAQLDINVVLTKVDNEYLVHFTNYYWRVTREKYINAAFERKNLAINWTFVPRSHLSDLYPSDFEVIQTTIPNVTDILKLHPAIRDVNQQNIITRDLKYTPQRNQTSVDYQSRHLLGVVPGHITDLLHVRDLWNRGITGKGIKVAVFDTGLPKHHPHFRNVKERTNWTNEKSLDDGVSHGTFVAGVIASSKECLGIAPDVELHIFRVCTNIQVSYTSWFLDAFNYAMFRKINVLNLSIGGPDFMDRPFVDKVLELSANKIIMISAIGNDGPLYGTLNNPGDQSDVIGVGGINSDDMVAKFSSRGMTTWELPRGYGRVKPDIVTYGSHVKGSNLNGGCRSLSGTSVASPVVAGAVALILSGALPKLPLVNPASVKQILAEGATKLKHNNIFEQGHGKLNVSKSMNLLLAYEPKITLSPAYMDYTDPYMWPYSSQPMYCGSMASIINVTIWNGWSVRGKILEEPQWHPNLEENGEILKVDISYSPLLWPWSGWMAVKIKVKDIDCLYEGEAEGSVSLSVETAGRNETIHFPIKVKISPKPPRHKRILWDQYHNIQYPPGYIPRDNLKIKTDPLDWRGDHLHTNFRDMYHHLRNHGYYIDVLGMPFTCFNASEYGTLLIVDPEEEFFDEEIQKLQEDVYDHGLGLIIFADWYNTTVMRNMKFFDENTREWWLPDTGGTNVPALNDLLEGFGISLSDDIAEGYYELGDHQVYYASGTTLNTFPRNKENIVISARLTDQANEVIKKKSDNTQEQKIHNTYPILGLFQMHENQRSTMKISSDLVTLELLEDENDLNDTHNHSDYNSVLNKRVLLEKKILKSGQIEIQNKDKNKKQALYLINESLNKKETKEGRIAIMGDSNCIDSTHAEKPCMWLLDALLAYTMNSHVASMFNKLNSMESYRNSKDWELRRSSPKRLKSSKLYRYSKVLHPKDKFRKRQLEVC
ncbi:membrane-bound transcription factor site-1 protease [Musca domestica]|uniref:Membrane-bound transcription factor site-1 protease n=1 Tax=Musca domestica TaxID=7370 RepID=A0A1I8NJH0_MUSDO|nr:membrane-bound transcription factor site-1 protease [Musca domestica]